MRGSPAGASARWASRSCGRQLYLRLTANYGHLMYDDAAIGSTSGDRNYSADAFGLRTIDFDWGVCFGEGSCHLLVIPAKAGISPVCYSVR